MGTNGQQLPPFPNFNRIPTDVQRNTPSPEHDSHNEDSEDMETQPDSQDPYNLANEGPVARDSLPEMTVSGMYAKGITTVIRQVIEASFEGPWICLQQVPKDVFAFWFRQFKNKYRWNLNDEHKIAEAFRGKCSKVIIKMMNTARQNLNQKPGWVVSVANWEKMKDAWATDMYKDKCEAAKKCRASNVDTAVPVYRGGSVSTTVHAKRLHDEIGHDPTPLQLFKRCWVAKDGLFPNEKSSELVGTLESLDSQNNNSATTNAATTGPPKNSIELLGEKLGGFNNRGRIPGLGSFAATIRIEVGRPVRSTQSAREAEKDRELEELRLERAQLRAEVNESRAKIDEMNERMTRFEELVRGLQQVNAQSTPWMFTPPP